MADSGIGDDAETRRRPLVLLGRFEVERIMGGGLATVYIARDTQFARRVALKTIKQTRADDPDAYNDLRQRFAREKEAHERIGNHPNLVTVHDFVIDRTDEDAPYLILEYVPGGSLAERIAQSPLSLDDALRLTADIARGLAIAHAQQVIHRDIKPGNIFLAADGRAQVGDFGIAQVGTLSGRSRTSESHPGTPLYMSPEQERMTGYVRAESDQYSVGLVLFEMLTGKPYRVLRGKAVVEHLAALPAEVRALFQRMTAENADERYESMAAVLAATEQIRGRLASSRDAPPRRSWEKLDRRAFLVGAGGLVVAGGVAGLLAYRHEAGGSTPVATRPTPVPTGAASAIITAPPTTGPASVPAPAAAPPTAAPQTSAPSASATASAAMMAWTEPRGLLTLRHPATWTRTETNLPPPTVLYLRGPENADFAAGILDPQQGSVAEEIATIQRSQENDTQSLFSETQTSGTTIGGEPAQRLRFSMAPRANPAAKSDGAWWMLNHEGRQFGFSATHIGTHRAEIEAIVASVTLTNAWTDSLGRVSLQYPSDWQLTQNTTKERVLQLRAPDTGTTFFLTIATPPFGTPDSEILDLLNFHKNDPQTLYKDGPSSDVRIGGEMGKMLTYVAISRSDATIPPSDSAVWEVNHSGSEFQFLTGNIGEHRAEVDAIIASVIFLR